MIAGAIIKGHEAVTLEVQASYKIAKGITWIRSIILSKLAKDSVTITVLIFCECQGNPLNLVGRLKQFVH